MEKCRDCRFYVKDVCYRYPVSVVKGEGMFCGEYVESVTVATPKMVTQYSDFVCSCEKKFGTAHGLKIHKGRSGHA